MAQILDGKLVAQKIREKVQTDVAELAINSRKVKLAIVSANSDPSSLSYVKTLIKTAEKVGIKTQLEQISPDQTKLEAVVNQLAKDSNTDAIMLQTPLPKQIDGSKLAALIPTDKDVDGANPLSTGLLNQGLDSFAPATAQAVMEILEFYKIELAGKNIVVLGRSNIVGKPVAQLLLAQNATITICHSKTQNISQITKTADVLIAAVGRSKFITEEFVNQNLTIVDVGINFDESGKMTGDVDFNNVEPLVKAITPVPGGVGPVTTAVLLKQVCQAAKTSL